MNKIITFKTAKQFKKIIKNLKQKGYNWVNDSETSSKTSFETIKNSLPKQTRAFAICFYYNEINKKLEMQFQTFNFYKREIKLRKKHGFNKTYEIVTL